ncbi:hypothetical protein ACLQ22_31280 [Micromonospora sp. DT178]|uniref:MmyB family transcriptional regulator n=1 Tax=Micromonospora sp. DT178 TaxID=3393436 RepID=UPI003CF5358F
MWASHDIGIRHGGVKRLQHPVVGLLELTCQPFALPTPLPRCGRCWPSGGAGCATESGCALSPTWWRTWVTTRGP